MIFLRLHFASLPHKNLQDAKYDLSTFVPAKFFLLVFFSASRVSMTRQRKKARKTLDELERRLHFEWKSVTLDTLKELARNGRKKNKGGHSGY